MVNPAADRLISRSAIFLGACLIYSGLLGPRIISHSLVGGDGFQVYGGLGKAALFGVLALGLLVFQKNKWPKLQDWHFLQAVLGLASLASYTGAWLAVSQLIKHSSSHWAIAANLLIILSLLLALAASFGLGNLKLLWQNFKKEIAISVGLAAIFYVWLILVYASWRFLSTTVLHSVAWLLVHLNHLSVSVIPPYYLLLSKFGIGIVEYCSGIESIALFSALYVLIAVLDWPRLNHQKLLGIFLPALIVLFGLNILRVYVLILGGYYINPQIAFSLFHTYAGMLFFILYSAIFWAIFYKRLLKKKLVDGTTSSN